MKGSNAWKKGLLGNHQILTSFISMATAGRSIEEVQCGGQIMRLV